MKGTTVGVAAVVVLALVAWGLASANASEQSGPTDEGQRPPETLPAASESQDQGPAPEPERDEVPADPPAQPRIVRTAMPTLTLAGHLESRLRSKSHKPKWSGDPGAVKPSKPAGQIAALRQFNPERKSISEQQARELQSIVDEFDARLRPVHANERNATHKALIRAVSSGQIETVELEGSPPLHDPAAFNRYNERVSEETQKRMQRLSERFGEDGADWSWSTMSSHEPDGVSRQNIVYFLRTTESGVFALRQEEAALISAQHQAYRQFFEWLR